MGTVTGPAPKDPSRRARRNKDPYPTTRLEFTPGTPPDLPNDIGIEWHPRTRAWWAVWQRSPMAQLMSEVDWEFHLDTALMHHGYWTRGHFTAAGELRARMGLFGATPADRLRLRIQWADADDKDAKIPQMGPVPSRSKYSGLKVAPVTPIRDDGKTE